VELTEIEHKVFNVLKCWRKNDCYVEGDVEDHEMFG